VSAKKGTGKKFVAKKNRTRMVVNKKINDRLRARERHEKKWPPRSGERESKVAYEHP